MVVQYLYRNATHAQNFPNVYVNKKNSTVVQVPSNNHKNVRLSIIFGIVHYHTAQFIPFNRSMTLLLLFSRHLLVITYKVWFLSKYRRNLRKSHTIDFYSQCRCFQQQIYAISKKKIKQREILKLALIIKR